MNLYDINDISKILKVSKTTVYNKLKLKQIKQFIIKKNGTKYLNLEGLKAVRSTLKQSLNQVENFGQNTVKIEEYLNDTSTDIESFKAPYETLIETLKSENNLLIEQLKEKDNQINIKDEQIREIHKLLENTQVLFKQSQDNNKILIGSDEVATDLEIKKPWYKKIFKGY